MTKPTALRIIDGDQPDAEPGRALPHNITAEQVVLGAMMLSSAALTEVRELLDGSEFYRPAHARIWETVTTLADRGAPCDPLAVGAELGPDLSKTGGAPYLHTLVAQVPTAANAGYYAHMIRDLAYAREVIETGTRLIQLGHEATGESASNLRGTVTTEVAELTSADVRGWPDPVPLTAMATDLPGFPLWTLPDWIGEYAASVAEVTQTPPDLAGCLALAVLAVAAGGKVWVQAPAWRGRRTFSPSSCCRPATANPRSSGRCAPRSSRRRRP